jgi:hypothetical protein
MEGGTVAAVPALQIPKPTNRVRRGFCRIFDEFQVKTAVTMSYRLMELYKGARMNAAAKAVALWLWYRANDQDEAWPGPTEISQATCLDYRTVTRALKLLERNGWIMVVGKGLRGVNRYRMTQGVEPGVTQGTTPGVSASTQGIPSTYPGHHAGGTQGVPSTTPGVAPYKGQEGHKGQGKGETIPPTDLAAPPLEAGDGTVGKDGDSERLAVLRECRAQFEMGKADLTGEWLSQAAGMTPEQIRATCALVPGALTPIHFGTARRKSERHAGNASGQTVLDVRAWLKERTGLRDIFVGNGELITALRRYGPESVMKLGKHALEIGGLSKELFGHWFDGRPSQYDGWDVYKPQKTLPVPLTDEQLAQALARVAS